MKRIWKLILPQEISVYNEDSFPSMCVSNHCTLPLIDQSDDENMALLSKFYEVNINIYFSNRMGEKYDDSH